MPSRAVTGFLALILAVAAGPTARGATGTPPATPPTGAAPATGKPAPAKPGTTTAKPAPPSKSAPAAAKPKPGDQWVVALEASLQRSVAALHHYEWTETTVVTVKGEEMSRKESRCRYGPDGKLQRDEPAEAADAGSKKKAPGGHGRAITTQVESRSDAIAEAVGLVKMYLPLDPARIRAASDAGRVTVKSPDAEGKARILVSDYLKTGDSVAIDLDTGKSRLAGFDVMTFTDKVKHAGALKVDMAALSDGTAYPSSAVLDIQDEGVTVSVKNGGHKQTPLPD